MVVELKRGKTPRDVTSQTLEYSSWVKNLRCDQITGIAAAHPGIVGTPETAFRFLEVALPMHLKAQVYAQLILEFVPQSETLFDHLQDTMRGCTFNNYSLCRSP